MRASLASAPRALGVIKRVAASVWVTIDVGARQHRILVDARQHNVFVDERQHVISSGSSCETCTSSPTTTVIAEMRAGSRIHH